jgi:ion channel
MGKDSNLLRFVKKYRSALLVAALVAEMIISPMGDYHPHVGALLAASVGLVVLAAASYMANERIVKLVVLPIAAVWFVARLLEAFGNRQNIDARVAPLAGLALSCAVLWAIFMRVRSISETTGATIAEAFIGYLIVATAFAQLYWILNQVIDKPFNQAIPNYEISTLVYFSLVTLTSVGYGGIMPINPYVRMVAAFEAVTGVFYIAVVVARLVSSYRRAERSRE